MVGQDDTLTTLYAGALGRVEHLQCSGRRRERGRKTCSQHFHVVLPLSGSFVWHPGSDEVFADSTSAVFAGAGEDFAISHPAGGDRSLVIWPNAAALEELTGRKRTECKSHPAFTSRARRTTREIQVLERALVAACSSPDNVLMIEETLARLLTLLFADSTSGEMREPRQATRTVSRAKALLQEKLPERLTLAETARGVGVSPIYLTQLFRACEGVPLYQYALDLRMAAALDALAQSDDITRLAIELGFSSHSHFSAAFRQRFGTPPSTLRAAWRNEEKRAPAKQERDVRPLCSARGGTSDLLWS